MERGPQSYRRLSAHVPAGGGFQLEVGCRSIPQILAGVRVGNIVPTLEIHSSSPHSSSPRGENRESPVDMAYIFYVTVRGLTWAILFFVGTVVVRPAAVAAIVR